MIDARDLHTRQGLSGESLWRERVFDVMAPGEQLAYRAGTAEEAKAFVAGVAYANRHRAKDPT